MSTDVDFGQQESRAAAEQPHHASAAAGCTSFTAGVSHQVLSCATPTLAPSPQPSKPVSTLLADSHVHSPAATVNSAGRQTGADDELGPDANAAASRLSGLSA
ncbi:TPA: hypothetical protein ACH3X1_012541 [Trebouxia sp. C0004]